MSATNPSRPAATPPIAAPLQLRECLASRHLCALMQSADHASLPIAKKLIPYSVFDASQLLQTRMQTLHEPRARPANRAICEKTLML